MINFKWRHFQKPLILVAVRCYVAYALSYRDIEELMLTDRFKSEERRDSQKIQAKMHEVFE